MKNMVMIMPFEIIEADRDHEDRVKIFYASDPKLTQLVPEGKIGWVYCQCEYGDKCPNNPTNKKLVGSFQLCGIQIKKVLDSPS